MTRPKQRKPKADPEADEAVYAAMVEAILDGRLRAGTRLPEHKLAAVFGVSRERIRKVLHRLGAERRVEIVPNRGARVPQPSPEDIRAVYEAHRVLEAGVLLQLSETPDPLLLRDLDDHIAQERAAAEAGDRAASVRLSGAFHMLLVDALGNGELSHFLRDLISRSSVMVSVYEPASESVCAVDEHAAIVEALRAGDTRRAIDLSRHHFRHVEDRLDLAFDAAPAPSLEDVFGASAGPTKATAVAPRKRQSGAR